MNALSLHAAPYRLRPANADDRQDAVELCERFPDRPDYPQRLQKWKRQKSVWLQGHPHLLAGDRPSCTVVGSRACSRDAEQRAFELGQKLAERGVLVVSGGALGIDAAAHRGALAAGGLTCAVLGTGVDVHYPRHNAELLAAIGREGVLLSMFPLGSPPMPLHFRVRNELMAALADVVIVVEAQARSGSLITARQALRYGRPLLCFPGSEGAVALLSAGARAVRSVDEAVACVASLVGPGAAVETYEQPLLTRVESATVSAAASLPSAAMLLSDDDAAVRVLAALAACPSADVGELCARTGLSAAECAAVLVDLELADRCTRLAGGRYMLHAPLS